MDRGVYTKATCQIFSNNIEFDWENPYKTYSEYISTGTGFFIDDKGTLLTCAHVIEDSIKTTIIVPSNGKNKIDVVLVSVNFDKDIALLRTVDFKNSAFLELGNSDQVNEEDDVVAIGFPLGEDRIKFTGGIVSGVQGRYIQTDAPINSGNSGGPLVLKKTKKVIGINTSKMSSADNIGYVTPINDYVLIANEMYGCADKEDKEEKILTVPDLGCSFMSTDDNLLEYMGVKNKTGYMIRDIVDTSPLKIAGIKSKDILLSFGPYKIDKYGEVNVGWSMQKVYIEDMMYKYKYGDKVSVSFWCGEDCIEKTVTVHFNVKYPYAIRKIRPIITPPKFETIYGLIVMPLYFNHLEILKSLPWTRNKKNKLISFSKKHDRVKPVLLISNVLPGSYVKETGMLKAGDLIDKINGIAVETIDQFREAFVKPKNQFIVIESKSKNILAIKIADILEHDKFLSEKYKYPLSSLIKELETTLKTKIVETGIPNDLDVFETGTNLPKSKIETMLNSLPENSEEDRS